MEGRKIDRSQLFGDDGSQADSDMDEHDFEAFEKMMAARINVQDQQQQQKQENTQEPEHEVAEEEQAKAPVFKLFAGSSLVKVETEAVEVEYIAPQRPEAQLEESDSEEHWSALMAAAIDADTIQTMSKIPLPALQFPKRVIHLKAGDGSKPDTSAKNPEKTKAKSKASCKRRKAQERKRTAKRQKASPPYERCVRSLFTGGLVKGKMLEDVIREEKAVAAAQARKVASSRGGFRGRGHSHSHSRGRGGSFGTGRPVASVGSRFSK
ncbi:hypothetical protein LPJ59_004758 [Coemansia sp. RSA 2399]|nr:hypothetical protein LPJ59_004758 [Coemansia sp. RSA 2399]KAJ1901642.1 hypothetical protein LPJ81_003719 [Coemansia sp. IMI 209127]